MIDKDNTVIKCTKCGAIYKDKNVTVCLKCGWVTKEVKKVITKSM